MRPALPRFAREIRFTDVGFQYPGDSQFALRHVSLTIVAGESVAFVGRNGSGRSTLLAMLLRRWDPSESTITVDGHNLRAITQDSLHAQFGDVFQEIILFNRSVRETMGHLAGTCTLVSVAHRLASVIDADRIFVIDGGG